MTDLFKKEVIDRLSSCHTMLSKYVEDNKLNSKISYDDYCAIVGTPAQQARNGNVPLFLYNLYRCMDSIVNDDPTDTAKFYIISNSIEMSMETISKYVTMKQYAEILEALSICRIYLAGVYSGMSNIIKHREQKQEKETRQDGIFTERYTNHNCD